MIKFIWEGKRESIKAAKIKKQYRLKPVLSLSCNGSKNMLIQSDNLTALKALIPLYRSKIQCCYIDPPYNTGNKFTHYKDKCSEDEWCSMIYPRLVLIRELLTDDGSLWISIDEHEQAPLKLISDEVFGESNFVCDVIWQSNTSPISCRKNISINHEYILLYAKNKIIWQPNKLISTMWFAKEVGTHAEGKREFKKIAKEINLTSIFDTVKPERLIRRILELTSKENDLILDAFMGSGTTAAVAHKMNRNFIGIEAGEQMHSIIIPRLKYVNSGFNFFVVK